MLYSSDGPFLFNVLIFTSVFWSKPHVLLGSSASVAHEVSSKRKSVIALVQVMVWKAYTSTRAPVQGPEPETYR